MMQSHTDGHMTIPRHLLTFGDVCKLTGLSPSRVRQLDQLLEPAVDVASRHRRYDPQVVQRFIRERAKSR